MCYDGDAAEVWSVRPRRARKTHQCDECRRAILPGTTDAELTEEWGGEVPPDVARALPYLRRFEQIRATYPEWARP
jgi:hypothetical protein